MPSSSADSVGALTRSFIPVGDAVCEETHDHMVMARGITRCISTVLDVRESHAARPQDVRIAALRGLPGGVTTHLTRNPEIMFGMLATTCEHHHSQARCAD